MSHNRLHNEMDVAMVDNADGASPILLVCEHASNYVPSEMDALGLSANALQSHVAWDPGALGVASALSAELDAVLVRSTVSRLVYDCNRPPSAKDAMPAKSEVYDIPGNVGLSDPARAARVQTYYDPFRTALAQQVARKNHPIIVTIHSFTPIFNGVPRDVEIGILHDTDTRLADALLRTQSALEPHVVERNAPYGPQDGVTHSLKVHALEQGHLNVMIEIRNDLIAGRDAQHAMARKLAPWFKQALSNIEGNTCNT